MEKIKADTAMRAIWKRAAEKALLLTLGYLALAVIVTYTSILLSTLIRWDGWEWFLVLMELPGYLFVITWCAVHGNTSQVVFCGEDWLLLPIAITLVVVFLISFFGLLRFYKKKC